MSDSPSQLPQPRSDGEAHSPCSGVCMLDQRYRWCAGCFRTPAEIGEWPHASDARKHEILAELDGREHKGEYSA